MNSKMAASVYCNAQALPDQQASEQSLVGASQQLYTNAQPRAYNYSQQHDNNFIQQQQQQQQQAYYQQPQQLQQLQHHHNHHFVDHLLAQQSADYSQQEQYAQTVDSADSYQQTYQTIDAYGNDLQVSDSLNNQYAQDPYNQLNNYQHQQQQHAYVDDQHSHHHHQQHQAQQMDSKANANLYLDDANYAHFVNTTNTNTSQHAYSQQQQQQQQHYRQDASQMSYVYGDNTPFINEPATPTMRQARTNNNNNQQLLSNVESFATVVESSGRRLSEVSLQQPSTSSQQQNANNYIQQQQRQQRQQLNVNAEINSNRQATSNELEQSATINAFVQQPTSSLVTTRQQSSSASASSVSESNKISLSDSSQTWLDSISRHLIEHMTKFGICVMDNFLGLAKGNQILKEVQLLFNNCESSKGQLVSDKLDAKTRNFNGFNPIRGDRVIWVDGCEIGCAQINELIQTLSSVVTNCARLSLYNNESEFDKRVINKRTKAMLACYPGNGTRYVKHVDNPNGDGRCITSIYYLNKDWDSQRDGGLLRMFPTGVNEIANISPLFDRVLFFWSDRRNPHEVQPSHRLRLAITVWFIDSLETQVDTNEQQQQQQQQQNSNNQKSTTS